MKNSFELNEDVLVKVIGKIVGIELVGEEGEEEIFYTVKINPNTFFTKSESNIESIVQR